MHSPPLDEGSLPPTPDFRLSPHLTPGQELVNEYPSLLSPSLSIYPELSVFDDVVESDTDETYTDDEPETQAEYEEDNGTPCFDLDYDSLHDGGHFLETIEERSEEIDVEDETLHVAEPQVEAEGKSSLPQLVELAKEIEVGLASSFPRDDTPPQSPAGSIMSFSGSISSVSRIRIRSRPASMRFQTAATLTLREQEQLLEARDKEIFSLKLENHFLQERLAQKNPEDIEAVTKNNIAVKVANHSLSIEIKKYRKQLKGLERDLQEYREESERNENALLERLREQEFALEEEKRRRERQRTKSLLNTTDRLSLDPAVLAERQATLEEELNAARDTLQQTNGELERLHRALEKANAAPSVQRNARFSDMEVDALRSTHEAHLREMQSELENARCELEGRNQKIEELGDALTSLKLENEQMEHEVRRAAVQRSQSRAEMTEEREALEAEKDALRDHAAALSIQLEQREKDIETRAEELDSYGAEIERQDEEIERLKQELADERARSDELHEENVEREARIKGLTRRVTNANASLVSRAEEIQLLRTQHAHVLSAAEIALQRSKGEVGKLNTQVIELGQTLERNASRSERELTEVLTRLQSREELCDQLRDKNTSISAEFAKLRDLYFNAQGLIAGYQTREDQLLASMGELARSRDKQQFARGAAELALKEIGEQLFDAEDELKKARLELDQIKSGLALQQAQSTVKSQGLLLEKREVDLSVLRSTLKELERQTAQLGEDRDSDLGISNLDLDRLQQKLQMREDEITQVREVLRERTRVMQEQHAHIDQLSLENRETSVHLQSIIHSRDATLERLKHSEESLRESESILQQFQTRAAELVQKQSADQQSRLLKEQQYHDQLTERNTLLLAAYHCVEKILGAEESKSSPTLTNFGIFRENLTNHLITLGQVRTAFEAAAKEIETRYSEKVNDVMHALNERNAHIEGLARMRDDWKDRIETKDMELKSSRVAISQLAVRVTALERQVNDQLKEIEHAREARHEPPAKATIEEAKDVPTSEMKEPSTPRGLTSRISSDSKAAEITELRAQELETNIKELHQQIEITNKRAVHLGTVLKTARRVLFAS